MIDVRRGAHRFRTVTPGIESRHSFSYGPHYDPDNLGFMALMAHNEDRLAPGAGFDRHAHRGVDIVTWVIDGTLEHQHWVDDLPARRERLTAGCLQVLRTAGGVEHAEHAAAGGGHVVDGYGAHYVQMWLTSGRPQARPDYARRDATPDLAEPDADGSVRPVTVASGRSDTAAGRALALGAPGAELAVARLPADAGLVLSETGSGEEGPSAHLFVTAGALRLDDALTLRSGDAVRLRGERPTLTAQSPTEVLLWRFTD